MKKVRITILKTTLDEELAREFGMIGLGPCPLMKAGEVYYADYAKPEGFCDEAWKAIYQYVFALAHGAGENLFYYGDWIRKPGVAIVSCNDGLRPVIMKLEATDIPSEPPKPAESREQSIKFKKTSLKRVSRLANPKAARRLKQKKTGADSESEPAPVGRD